MKKLVCAVVIAGLSVASGLPVACTKETKVTEMAPAVSEDAGRKEFEEWKAVRTKRLQSPDGWLTLVGLFWLKPGDNAFGSAASNPVALPAKAPATAGTITLEDERVTLKPAKNSGLMVDGRPAAGPVELKADVTGAPTKLSVGSVNFYLIKRGDKLGVRIRDAESEVLKNFKGLDYFPYNPQARIVAKLVPNNPPQPIPILNVLGQVEDMPSPGTLVFTVNGQEQRLEAVLEEGETDLFVIFGDATNGKETYGAGRFLYAKPADTAGNVVLDFNQSYNPPCAFTRFATCPLPPPQNRLKVRIEAGEKKFGEGHS